MDISPEDGATQDQHGTDDMDEDQESNVANYPMSDDEDGDFQDDLVSLDGDIHVAPNALSEKVARFVECFSVTGDVARLYLERNGEDIERTSQEFLGISDVKNSAASRRRRVCDSPVTSNEHGESSYAGGGLGGPSGSGDVDRQNKGNGKGKQKATDNDDDPYKKAKLDDDSSSDYDDNDDHHSNRLLSNNRFHALLASQGTILQESDVAYMQALASPCTQSDLPRRRGPFRARDFLGMATQEGRHASSSTSGLLEGDRGRTTERTSIGRERDTLATSNNEGAPVRLSRATVRRDSSLGLAANYSEDGQQVSEYRPYESPSATTSSRQVAEQRMRYLASDENTAQDSTEHRSNSNEQSSPLRQSGQHDGPAYTSSVLNGFSALQSQPQQDSLHNEYHTLGGAAHSAYTSTQATFGPAPFSGYNPLFGPPRLGMQFPPRAESSNAVQANAQWSGGNYYSGRGSNTLVPIAGPYPPSYVSAPSSNGDWGQTGLGELGSSSSAATVARNMRSGANRQAATQFTQQSSAPHTNNTVAPPSLQHPGLTSNLDGMDIDTTDNGSPEEAPVNSKQKQDGNF